MNKRLRSDLVANDDNTHASWKRSIFYITNQSHSLSIANLNRPATTNEGRYSTMTDHPCPNSQTNPSFVSPAIRTNANLKFVARHSQKLKKTNRNPIHNEPFPNPVLNNNFQSRTQLHLTQQHTISISIHSLPRDIVWQIIEFAAFSDYKHIALVNVKWNRSLNTHKHIFQLYQLDFGDTFEAVYSGSAFKVIPNHKKLKLFISLQTNPLQLATNALSVPYFYRCSKWVMSPKSNCRNHAKAFDEKTFKYFRSNDFVTSCVVLSSHINTGILPLNKVIIARLEHLTLSCLRGTSVLKELASLEISHLLCLEVTDINLCGDNTAATILNIIFKKCAHLLFFKFSAHTMKPLPIHSNKIEIETVKFGSKLQWISLTLFTNYFDVDLSSNDDIIGLHLRDKQLRSESIVWPKYGYIQCLTLESFRGFTSNYIAAWNRYSDAWYF